MALDEKIFKYLLVLELIQIRRTLFYEFRQNRILLAVVEGSERNSLEGSIAALPDAYIKSPCISFDIDDDDDEASAKRGCRIRNSKKM